MKRFFVCMLTTLVMLSVVACGLPMDSGGENFIEESTSSFYEVKEHLPHQTGKSFYNLYEAYENGCITNEHLRDIAYYYHDRAGKVYDEGYIPTPKTPETLNAEIEKEIKQRYLQEELNMPEGSVERVNIYYYYGTYNGHIAIGIIDDYNAYDLWIEPEFTVGEITFYQYVMSAIYIWHQ